jgi:hypothetical protein
MYEDDLEAEGCTMGWWETSRKPWLKYTAGKTIEKIKNAVLPRSIVGGLTIRRRKLICSSKAFR